MTTKCQSRQPISALYPEQKGWVSRARGVHSGKSSGAGKVAKQGEEEKMQEPHCIRLYAGSVSHILSSLEKANESCKKQKSIPKAGKWEHVPWPEPVE